MKTYAGIDLHSSNNYLGIIDGQDKRLFSRRLPNCINTIVKAGGGWPRQLVAWVAQQQEVQSSDTVDIG